ncbi:SDR family NAD(P)-dependent oxidoreductase [Candidatus Poriferisocius sp.]|uniref:SDR family NAD(P)-dependent oxidoreductase n=1 Tax=Candidatus Poriferisocius sp. TaxID=3101276 RepID=UPI003B018D1B
MKDLVGKVAVITGAASGMGRAMVRKAVSEQMHVLAGDIDEAGLAETVGGLENAQLMLTDVTSPDANEALAIAALERFGAINLLHLNAGVLTGGFTWENTVDDWRWVLDVNLWGVIHGVRSFVPRMLEAGEPGHVVITASVGGLTSGGLLGPYTTSKYGAVAIAESLHRELEMIGAPIGVSCLCPGPVATGIFRSERNRPDTYEDTCGPSSADAEAAAFHENLITAIDEGTNPEVIPELVFDAVRNDKFWIFPHPEFKERIAARTDSIINETNPDYTVGMPTR